jgi:hypothetical protein
MGFLWYVALRSGWAGTQVWIAPPLPFSGSLAAKGTGCKRSITPVGGRCSLNMAFWQWALLIHGSLSIGLCITSLSRQQKHGKPWVNGGKSQQEHTQIYIAGREQTECAEQGLSVCVFVNTFVGATQFWISWYVPEVCLMVKNQWREIVWYLSFVMMWLWRVNTPYINTGRHAKIIGQCMGFGASQWVVCSFGRMYWLTSTTGLQLDWFWLVVDQVVSNLDE